MRRLLLIALAGLALLATGADCLLDNIGNGQLKVAALRGFTSGEQLRRYLAREANGNQSNGGGVWMWRGGIMPLAAPPEAVNDADGAAGAGSGEPYSTTNTQEAGVDESDIVKNDGDMIYVLDGSTIHIVQATPTEELDELATVEIPEHGNSLYLYGDKLIALSQKWIYYYYPMPWEPVIVFAEDDGDSDAVADIVGGDWSDGTETTVTVIDVSDPANPVVDTTIRFEGQLATSRMIANQLHVVMTTLPRLPPIPIPLNVNDMTLEEWLPDFEILDGGGAVVSEGDIVGWQDVFRPDEANGYGITTVVTVDMDDPDGEFDSTAITANAGVIYASTEALYVTDTEYDWSTFGAREDTAVHKFAFDNGGADYVASGFVPGRPLNQYSLGEHEDYLRIATTVNTFEPDVGNQVSNNLFVMGEDGLALDVVGSIEGIAPGETIFAARFIGERGFLVTFERIDPLFTFDLSDPFNPVQMGDLHIPGFSDHIQLLDENHLLTIGKDTEDAGDWAWIKGVQLSVFDVTDMENPALLHKEVIGGRGTHSEANHNPKAFNYFAAANALAFPIDIYGTPEQTGPEWSGHEFTGLIVYEVTVEDGFTELGRISSMDGVPETGCYWSYWGFTRGVFIGDTVYSVTQNGVKAADLDDVDTIVAETEFEEPVGWDECWYYLDEPMVIMPGGGGIR